MIKFEDTFNAYQSRNYPPAEHCSSMFNEELKQYYQQNKTEIFDYYEPRALAETLAGVNNDKVMISDFGLYTWKLEIKAPKMVLEIAAGGRPDIYCVKYVTEVIPRAGIRMGRNLYDSMSHEKISDEIKNYLWHETNEALNTLPIPSEVYDCEARLKTDFSNMSVILWNEIDITVKQFPSLDNVKFMEYTVPRIVYDKMIDVSEKLEQL